MNITDLLKPEAIRVVASATSKKRLFSDISEIAASCYDFDAATVTDALLERENLGPTGVGHGVALPHARLKQYQGPVCGIFVRLQKPLEYNSVDNQPVDLLFTLLAPDTGGVAHLRALAAVSRVMRSPDVCTKLRANTDPSTVYAILTEVKSSKVA